MSKRGGDEQERRENKVRERETKGVPERTVTNKNLLFTS